MKATNASTVVNDFSYESWLNFTSATAAIRIDPQTNASTVGTSGQHYAFSPDNRGADAGAGLSAGTNGLAVYEHATATYLQSWSGSRLQGVRSAVGITSPWSTATGSPPSTSTV